MMKLRKLIFGLVLCFAAFTLVNNSKAYAKTSGFWDYDTFYDNPKEIRITGYNGLDSDLQIPSSIDGLKVVEIWDKCFEGEEDIIRVTIPNTVKKIGNFAFWNCPNLEYVDTGNGVTMIGYGCFGESKKLKTVLLSKNLKEMDYRFDLYGTFINCESLEKVEIPAGVETLYPGTFYGCTNLKTVILNEGLKYIKGNERNDSIFEGCASLQSMTFPDSLLEIEDECFEGVTSLTKVSFGKNLKSIGNSAFSGCTGITSISFPNGLQSIGISAFYNTSITQLSLPDSLTSLGSGAFAHCKKLESASIPGSIRTISHLFDKCESLKTVKLNEGLLEIGDSTFQDCTSLQEIIIPNTVIKLSTEKFTWAHNPNLFGGENNPKVVIPTSVREISTLLFGKSEIGDLYVYEGSYAEEFMKAQNWSYTALEAIPASSIKLTANSTRIGAGFSTLTLSTTLEPANTTDAILWKSSAPDIASVDDLGIVTGLRAGSVVIRATTSSGKHADITLNVAEGPSNVTVTKRSVTLGVGETFTQKGKITNNPIDKTLTYSSSNTKIATVDKKGKVKAISEGKSVIKISAYNGRYTSYEVIVKKAPGSVKLTSSSKTVKIGSQLQLTTTLPKYTYSNTYNYTSSNDKIATVNSKGVVKGKKAGAVTIKVKTSNGKTSTIKIKVVKK